MCTHRVLLLTQVTGMFYKKNWSRRVENFHEIYALINNNSIIAFDYKKRFQMSMFLVC